MRIQQKTGTLRTVRKQSLLRNSTEKASGFRSERYIMRQEAEAQNRTLEPKPRVCAEGPCGAHRLAEAHECRQWWDRKRQDFKSEDLRDRHWLLSRADWKTRSKRVLNPTAVHSSVFYDNLSLLDNTVLNSMQLATL